MPNFEIKVNKFGYYVPSFRITFNQKLLNILSEIFSNASVVLIFYCIIDVRRKVLMIHSLTSELERNYILFNIELIRRIGSILSHNATENAQATSKKIKRNVEIIVYSKYDFFRDNATPETKEFIKEKLIEERMFMTLETSSLINTINKLIELEYLSNDKKNILSNIKEDIEYIKPGPGFLNMVASPLYKFIHNSHKHTIFEDDIIKIINDLNNDINSL